MSEFLCDNGGFCEEKEFKNSMNHKYSKPGRKLPTRKTSETVSKSDKSNDSRVQRLF